MNFVPLVLAIEFPQPTRCVSYLPRERSQALANQLAFELAKQLPSVEGLGLVWMAAGYDQAQLLRPGLPVHQALFDLYQAGVRDAEQLPQLLTLQALRGQAPVPELMVDESLLGGPMLFIPLAIVGSAAVLKNAEDILEARLLDTGLADARTALFISQALGTDAEHARLMTLNDLAAMAAMQLDHNGFGDVWQAIESQVFGAPLTLNSDWLVLDDRQQVSLLIDGWQPSQSIEEIADRKLRERQAQALLTAHHIAFVWRAKNTDLQIAADQSFALQCLDRLQVRAMDEIRHAGLGVLAYQLFDANQAPLGYAFPLQANAYPALCAALPNATCQ